MTVSDTHYLAALENLAASDQLRAFKDIESRSGKHITYRTKNCLNLSSNDYLGLAANAALAREFYQTLPKDLTSPESDDIMINQYGLGASSSRLLTGNSALYETLEESICQWYQAKAALIFNSGYHANVGMIQALAGKNDLVLSDSLNHASIIDGIRLSRSVYKVFNHNDMQHLEQLLDEHQGSYDNIWIITESLFSMDGDRADIKGLVALKEKYQAMLYIDEAHSAGLFGPQGQGLCYEQGLSHKVDILLGTFGKALASHGAYAVTRPVIKSFLINNARSLIFSTALPPVAISWNLFMIQQVSHLSLQRQQLQTVCEKFRSALVELGLHVVGDSHIIPVITGSNHDTVRVSDRLFESGFLAFPIRPPSVPKGNSRIRFSLTSDIRFEDIQGLPGLIHGHVTKGQTSASQRKQSI